jgi:hypothetical protein
LVVDQLSIQPMNRPVIQPMDRLVFSGGRSRRQRLLLSALI